MFYLYKFFTSIFSFLQVNYCLYLNLESSTIDKNKDKFNNKIQKIQRKFPEVSKDEILKILKNNDNNFTKTELELVRICNKILNEQNDNLGTNMTEEHLIKELDILKNRFPKLEQNYILEILKKNKGHAGKATNEIFKIGGEGVKEAEEEFYKHFPGGFINKDVTQTHMVYLWNIRFDASFNRNRNSFITTDSKGNEVELFECDSILICKSDEDIKYPNHKYFDDLARDGDNPYSKINWGTDQNEIYDEIHPLNTKEVIMTQYELETIINVWKIPLLGKHPYINEDGLRCYYLGLESQKRTKKKLPEGWTRSVGEEYNGLYFYKNKEKNIIQWKHPLD